VGLVLVVILLDKKGLIKMIKDRHTNQSSFNTGEWTNHHGLEFAAAVEELNTIYQAIIL
jgi:hypothetical protein